MNQLRYSGMMETVRIRRSGYPVRRAFADFLFRYGMLGRNLGLPEGKEKCGAIMKMHDPEGKDWQNGKTKVGGRMIGLGRRSLKGMLTTGIRISFLCTGASLLVVSQF